MNSNKDETAAEKVLRTHIGWNLEGPQREGEMMMQGITLIWTQHSTVSTIPTPLERFKPIGKQVISILQLSVTYNRTCLQQAKRYLSPSFYG